MDANDVVEIEQIRQLKARYFRLMDQKKWSEWVDVFTEDVRIETPIDTPDQGAIVGREAFVTYLSPILEGVITCHHGHMSEIAVTGPDSAEGIWSMEDHLDWPPESGMGKMWGTGWYREQYRKGDDGRWRIASLVLERIRIEVDGNRVYPPA